MSRHVQAKGVLVLKPSEVNEGGTDFRDPSAVAELLEGCRVIMNSGRHLLVHLPLARASVGLGIVQLALSSDRPSCRKETRRIRRLWWATPLQKRPCSWPWTSRNGGQGDDRESRWIAPLAVSTSAVPESQTTGSSSGPVPLRHELQEGHTGPLSERNPIGAST